MTNEELKRALVLLASQQRDLLSKKMVWDKLQVIMPLISGLSVVAIGAIISHGITTRQNQSLKAEKAEKDRLAKTELVGKFVPYFSGTENESAAAILALSVLEDHDLMRAFAQTRGGEGIQRGLSTIAANGTTELLRFRAAHALNIVTTVQEAAEVPLVGYGGNALSIALNELRNGVTEEPPLQGTNHSPRIDSYAYDTQYPAGAPWSAIFVSWVYRQALPKGESLPFKLSPQFAMLKASLKEAGCWKDASSNYKPRAGDLVIYRTRAGSVGGHGGIFVKAMDADKALVIEGNSSLPGWSRAVETVVGKSRLLSQIEGYGAMSALFDDSVEDDQ